MTMFHLSVIIFIDVCESIIYIREYTTQFCFHETSKKLVKGKKIYFCLDSVLKNAL